MSKKLEEMSLRELWQLFPIFLTEHNSNWKDWYFEQETDLTVALPTDAVFRISHVGSTAIEQIWAKPIVDILVELKKGADIAAIGQLLIRHGWRCMSQETKRMSLNLGYTEAGFAEKVYHLHLRFAGDNDELYFRDYMKEHPAAAKEYETLKLALWKRHEQNRDAYTLAKTAFVRQITEKAKIEYLGRY